MLIIHLLVNGLQNFCLIFNYLYMLQYWILRLADYFRRHGNILQFQRRSLANHNDECIWNGMLEARCYRLAPLAIWKKSYSSHLFPKYMLQKLFFRALNTKKNPWPGSRVQWRKSVPRSGGMIKIWRWDFSGEHTHTYTHYTLHHTHTHFLGKLPETKYNARRGGGGGGLVHFFFFTAPESVLYGSIGLGVHEIPVIPAKIIDEHKKKVMIIIFLKITNLLPFLPKFAQSLPDFARNLPEFAPRNLARILPEICSNSYIGNFFGGGTVPPPCPPVSYAYAPIAQIFTERRAAPLILVSIPPKVKKKI